MTTTAPEITPERRLTIVKHLATGKTLDAVATITRLDRSVVLDIGSKHGYPSVALMEKAAGILTRNIEEGRTDALPEASTIPSTTPRAPRSTSPSSVTVGDARPSAHGPDQLRILINTAKSHPSKKIQTAADRLLDNIGKLKDLLREDEEKHAERRKAEAERAAAKAEVERLEQQLRAAKAKLSGKKTPPQAPTGQRSERLTRGDFPCRNDGCDKHHDTPQGRSMHERMHCEHRTEAVSA